MSINIKQNGELHAIANLNNEKSIELTLAEYNALPQTEKDKDITYYITDLPATSSNLAGGVSLATQGGAENTLRFGIDEEGNYGYYKPGADTVTPFKSGSEDYYTLLYQSGVSTYIPDGIGYVLGNTHTGGGSIVYTIDSSSIRHDGGYEPYMLFLSKIKGSKLNISMKLSEVSNTSRYGGAFYIRFYKSLKNLAVGQNSANKYNSTIKDDDSNEDLLYKKAEIAGTSVPSKYTTTFTLSIDISSFKDCYLCINSWNYYTYIYKIWVE